MPTHKPQKPFPFRAKTHLALGKDAPEPRPVQTPEHGPVIEIPGVAVFTTDKRGVRRSTAASHLPYDFVAPTTR
jgi:hypothetical protein